jgi:hypothetical protein
LAPLGALGSTMSQRMRRTLGVRGSDRSSPASCRGQRCRQWCESLVMGDGRGKTGAAGEAEHGKGRNADMGMRQERRRAARRTSSSNRQAGSNSASSASLPCLASTSFPEGVYATGRQRCGGSRSTGFGTASPHLGVPQARVDRDVATHDTAEPASSAGDEHRVGLLVAVSVDSVGDSHDGKVSGIRMREWGCKCKWVNTRRRVVRVF